MQFRSLKQTINRRFFILFILLIISAKTKCSNQLPPALLKKVEEVEQLYAQRKNFDTTKIIQINTIKEEILNCEELSEKKYNLYKDLFKQYFSYKNTEAYRCALAMEEIAKKTDDSIVQTEALIYKAEILLSSGLFKEATDILNQTRSCTTSNNKKHFYKLTTRLYSDLKSHNDLLAYKEEYDSLYHVYSDSLLIYADTNSIEFLMTSIFKLEDDKDIEFALSNCTKILQDTILADHQKAMLYSCMAWCAEQNGNTEEQIQYLLKSIEFDIRSSTYETTSSRVLAQILLKKGEIELANKFALYAIEDAEFYGALQRKAEITPIIPIIEKKLNQLQTFKTNAILAISLFIFLSLLIIFYLWIRLVKQHRKLKNAQEDIKEKNSLLSQQNMQLSESNKIKEEYLTNYFELSSVYFHEMENMQNKIKSLLLQKKFSSIEKFLNESGPKEDKERLLGHFDKLFLSLFPDFITNINKVLHEPIAEPDKGKLSSEMRVFALNRLGITDTDRIASILGVSRNTIYTYRNRIKSKTVLNSEDFDRFILGIPSF